MSKVTLEQRIQVEVDQRFLGDFVSANKGEVKMIDLKNTYIENDCGELRELYQLECFKQGIQWSRGANIKHFACQFISTQNFSHGFELCTSGALMGGKLKKISLFDLKPKRTKTEHVKCDISEAKDYHVNELVFKWGEDLVTPLADVDASTFIINQHKLYRKVEREVTWQDELAEHVRKESIQLSMPFTEKAQFFNMGNVEESKFIEMCHLVASMTDNPKKEG